MDTAENLRHESLVCLARIMADDIVGRLVAAAAGDGGEEEEGKRRTFEELAQSRPDLMTGLWSLARLCAEAKKLRHRGVKTVDRGDGGRAAVRYEFRDGGAVPAEVLGVLKKALRATVEKGYGGWDAMVLMMALN